jgi:hypothetical protein
MMEKMKVVSQEFMEDMTKAEDKKTEKTTVKK